MVYTVTLNPALDYVVRMGTFRDGEINRTESEEIQYGGKGINVSAVLKTLGVESIALGFVAGFTGKALEDGLRDAGIHTDFVTLPQGLTRINVKIKSGIETEINANGPAIGEEELEQLYSKLDKMKEGDMLVLSGSVPSSLSQDIYEKILLRLQGKGISFVVDSTRNLLCNALSYHPFLIKPNHLELGEIFGRELYSDEEIRECAAKLQECGARNVLVSMAGEGSLLLDETGTCHRLGVPEGVVRNSVGAGDSMVGGFLAGWLKTGEYAYAHRMGAAAGSATAFSDGLASQEMILQMMEELL